MAYFLGLDSSTQSLSAMVIDTDTGEVVLDKSVIFGTDLPQYHSPSGFLENPDPLVRHSDPLMWLDALDKVLADCQADGYDWSQVVGICGSGQQHGSVYCNAAIDSVLAGLDTGKSLADQIKPALSRPTSPIWMDSSTRAECDEIAAAIGSDEEVSRISGSRAIERFTGPQIRKFYKEDEAAYNATARIHLVSSFMASVLAGANVGIDLGDGAGMNLLELATDDWSPVLLDATAPGLDAKLSKPVAGASQAGTMAAYFVEKYGFSADCVVMPFSGDNPCSLVGMGATKPGTAVVSLGTSDTFFAAMGTPVADPKGYGHVFGNPAGGFMSLVCFKNGSLAREAVVEKAGGMNWDEFADAILNRTPAGNNGNWMLPFFEAETTPLVLDPGCRVFGEDSFTNWTDKAAAAKAVIEAQAINMKVHSAWIGETPTLIRVTGGASRNQGILQVFADVFQATLQRLTVTNSAALGAALRAANGVGKLDWNELTETFCDLDPDVVTPNPDNAAVYAEMEVSYLAGLQKEYGV